MKKVFTFIRRLIKTLVFIFIVLPLVSLGLFTAWVFLDPTPPPEKNVINEAIKLDPFVPATIVHPQTNEDVQKAVKEHEGPISIGGGRYSMGGQTGTDNTLFIDMSGMNKILEYKPLEKAITVQAGARWKDIQQTVDGDNLSVKIMQTYDNFTVGGSLSVNVHGRYIGQGPLIMSARSIKMVLADGSLVTASPTENSDLFYGAIGGYGGLGVITEATLDLADNDTIRRYVEPMPITVYKEYFFEKVRNNADAIFHNGDIYPPDYSDVNAVTWMKTTDPVTTNDRFRPVKTNYWLENFFYYWVTDLPGGGAARQKWIDPYYFYKDDLVAKRNYEASYDVAELMPLNHGSSTYALEEYFIPVEKFDEFVPKMREILKKHHVRMMNVSIRHAGKDPGSTMAWARTEVFAFVMYFKQDTSVAGREETGIWTREMIDAVISEGGTYYLPYQIFATQKQFWAAYPNAGAFFALKQKYDPANKFRNRLWDKYYVPAADAVLAQKADDTPHYYRPEDQTFLTIPEWHIVFESAEYADALVHRPSAFPYFAMIRQYWNIYRRIRQKTEAEYPPNPEYHTMVKVIGISTAAELAVKGVYENTVGRVTEMIAGRSDLTSDMKVESFMRDTEENYVSFIHQRPWYEYPFKKKYDELQEILEWPGTNHIRSAERRFFFGAELLFKSFYAHMIEQATHASYEKPDLKTWATVERGGQKNLEPLPRYQDFTPAAVKAAGEGANFVDIAGNKKILLTVLAPRGWSFDGKGEVFTEWPILTDPGSKRVALLLQVSDLADFLRGLDGKPYKLDHVFDY